CLGGPQRDQQVVKQQHGPARTQSYDLAMLVELPTFRKAGQNEIAPVRINEYITHPLHPSQVANLVRDWYACPRVLRNDSLETPQRQLAQRTRWLEVHPHFLEGLGPDLP